MQRTPSTQHRRPLARGGFTIIELLVVMAIITILMALLAAAVYKMLAAPPQKNTETLIQKLALALEGQWTAVITSARSEKIDPGIWAQCQAAAGTPDPQPAMDVYIQMRLVQEFPTSFAQAQGPGILPPIQPFAVTNGQTAPFSPQGNNPTESSICLYLALMVAHRGKEFDAGGLSPKEARTVPGTQLKGIYDYWDEPIQFSTYAVDPRGNVVAIGTPGSQMKFRIVSSGANRFLGDGDDISSDTLRFAK
jgi:prepilin-type N-terminal cleavage/methylation domain-containing protein